MEKGLVKLYGNINSWNENSAQEFVKRLEEAAKEADVVKIPTHCFGGSVTEGIVIYNAIKRCKKPVHVYIDGVAASMAAIIVMAADKVFMSDNALIMIHAPGGYPEGRGTLKDYQNTIKLLKALESGFIKAITSRSGKDEANVREWLDGDTWFSAEEAKKEGLIDDIVDSVAKNIDTIQLDSVTIEGVEAIYNRFTAELFTDKTNINQKQNLMDKEKLIETLGLSGVTAQSSDAEIEAAIASKQKADKEALEKAQGEVTAQSTARITAAIDQYKDKITVAQRSHFLEIGQKCGFEALAAALAPLGSQKTIVEQISGGSTPQPTASWNFDQWQEKDPKGLEKLAKEDTAAFNALYKDKFGTEPK